MWLFACATIRELSRSTVTRSAAAHAASLLSVTAGSGTIGTTSSTAELHPPPIHHSIRNSHLSGFDMCQITRLFLSP